jgi:hypothetical protein
MEGLYRLMGGGMKAYKVLCLVAFEVAISNDRHRDWFLLGRF